MACYRCNGSGTVPGLHGCPDCGGTGRGGSGTSGWSGTGGFSGTNPGTGVNQGGLWGTSHSTDVNVPRTAEAVGPYRTAIGNSSGEGDPIAIGIESLGFIVFKLVALGLVVFGLWAVPTYKPNLASESEAIRLWLFGRSALGWTLLAAPLAALSVLLRRTAGGKFTIVNCMGWAAISLVGASVAMTAAGWEQTELFGREIAIVFATLAVVAAFALHSPYARSGLRLWAMGMLAMAAISIVNWAAQPSTAVGCLAVENRNLWLLISPLSASTFGNQAVVGPGNRTCDGIFLTVPTGAAAGPTKSVVAKKSGRTDGARLTSNRRATSPAGESAFDRSMAAFLGAVALAVALTEAAIAALLIILAWCGRQQHAYRPAQIGRVSIIAGLLALVSAAAWVGASSTPSVPMTIATLRPLILIALWNVETSARHGFDTVTQSLLTRPSQTGS